MVNDLLELSRLQNPDYAIEKTRLNLPDVLEDAVRSIKYMASNSNVVLDCDYAVRDFAVMGDYGRLRQMFIAVLDNAIKFSDKGQTILIKTWLHNGHYHVSVTDKGKGIRADDLPHVFERFFKTNHQDKNKGTGLGLSIAKQIADRHGITLTVTSTQKEGTSFTFVAVTHQCS
jgi:signal transduction histidine kinase